MRYAAAARNMDKTGLIATDVALLLILANRSNEYGWCNPHQRTLADDLGVSVATIKKSIAKLIKLGVLSVTRGKDQRKTLKPNYYYLHANVMEAKVMSSRIRTKESTNDHGLYEYPNQGSSEGEGTATRLATQEQYKNNTRTDQRMRAESIESIASDPERAKNLIELLSRSWNGTPS